MEIDLSDSQSAELVEGLKRPAEDAPEGDTGGDSEDGPDPAGDAPPGNAGGRGGHREPQGEPQPRAPGVGIDPAEFDEAIGKMWIVASGILAKQLDEPELKEEKEMAQEAADALGPVCRKHIPRQLQSYGVEAVALAWISGRIYSKYQAIEE